jgi:branched-subunit amino acid aminotransferase/4-amino-4-deoxychorismate lyase
VERKVLLDDLVRADETFTAGTSFEVLPVTEIENVGSFEIGPVTREAMERVTARVERELA